MFLAFQHPEAIPGVSVIQFLRQALSNRTGTDLTVLELPPQVDDGPAVEDPIGRLQDEAAVVAGSRHAAPSYSSSRRQALARLSAYSFQR